MAVRRLLVLLLALATAAGLTALMAATLAPAGWTALTVLILADFALIAAWAGLGVANGLIGWAILTCARDPIRAAFGLDRMPLASAPLPRTAIVVTVRHEPFGDILPPLRALLDGLDATPHHAAFAVFILSDTDHPGIAAGEEAAFAQFRRCDRSPDRLHYRRRADRQGFKAGNIMDFLDGAAAADFALMLTLDADSSMTAAAVLRLAAVMQADPRLGIVQHLTVGRPATSAFARLTQFGMRAGMRSWATGQGWWQGDQGPYWGHNAMVRIAPFRAHCRLGPLPDGRAILSHDQVEAVRMRAAGWHVRVLPIEDGSREAFPPALPEFLARDRRWLAGNMQYRHLIGGSGPTWMGRWHLLQAMLLFAAAPFSMLLLACCAVLGARGGGGGVHAPTAAGLVLAWLAAAHAPKLLGYAEAAFHRRKRAAYGGGIRLGASAATETLFALLLDPVIAASRTIAFLGLVRRWAEGWHPHNRQDRGVGWREATGLLWPHTLIGLAAFACLAHASALAVLLALPLAGGLPLAIPLCVLTTRPGLGVWMRRRGLAAMPEEIGPAAPVAEAGAIPATAALGKA